MYNDLENEHGIRAQFKGLLISKFFFFNYTLFLGW